MIEIEKKLKHCLKKAFPKDKIPKNIVKLKIGNPKSWDSLGHVNFLLIIEKQFSIKISFKKISELNDINKILKFLKKEI